MMTVRVQTMIRVRGEDDGEENYDSGGDGSAGGSHATSKTKTASSGAADRGRDEPEATGLAARR